MLNKALKFFGWATIIVSVVFYVQQLPGNIQAAYANEGMTVIGILLGGLFILLQGMTLGLLCLWASRKES